MNTENSQTMPKEDQKFVENLILKITIWGNEIRCKYCDSFYITHVEFYGRPFDKLNRINAVEFICPYHTAQGVQKAKVKKITGDKVHVIDISVQFAEEMQAKKEMETLIGQMIEAVSKGLTNIEFIRDIRYYIEFITNRKKEFYGDFIYSTTLQRPPDPIAYLNSARSIFESMESGHCPDSEKHEWISKALSYLQTVKTELKYTHRNLY